MEHKIHEFLEGKKFKFTSKNRERIINGIKNVFSNGGNNCIILKDKSFDENDWNELFLCFKNLYQNEFMEIKKLVISNQNLPINHVMDVLNKNGNKNSIYFIKINLMISDFFEKPIENKFYVFFYDTD